MPANLASRLRSTALAALLLAPAAASAQAVIDFDDDDRPIVHEVLRPEVATMIAPPIPTQRLGFTGTFLPGRGLRVEQVEWGTKAERLGLERGDVLLEINGQRLRSLGHYFQLLEDAAAWNDGRVSLVVRNVRGNPLYVTMNFRLDGPQQTAPVELPVPTELP